MKIARIASEMALAPQLSPDDLKDVAAAGFGSVVNNRPDNEEPGQPRSAMFKVAAERLGLAYRHVPVVGGQIGENDVVAFERALRDMPKPILAFCRTGTRSASLWALVEAKRHKVDNIIAAAASSGYDLETLRYRLAAIAAGATRDHAE